jgi:predicted permease
MLKNYLKVALRSLARHKGYTFINMMGLSVAMACGILVLLWVSDELSYDRFHDGYRSIYRINTRDSQGDRTNYYEYVPYALADQLKSDFPQIESVARFYSSHFMVTFGESPSTEPNGAFVDPEFFSMFSFPLVKGNYFSKGMGSHCVILSDRMAERYFGEDDPLGKTLSLDNKMDFRVVGVVHIPAQSSLQSDFFIPMDALATFDPLLVSQKNMWRRFAFRTFVKLRPNADLLFLRQAIHGILKPHIGHSWYLELQRLDRIHLYRMDGAGDQIQYVYSFSLVALFVLLIACVNYVNLATARAESRSREVWIRKSLGAQKRQLAAQYMGESLVLTFIAAMMSLVLVELALPFFNALAGSQVNLAFDDVSFAVQFLALVALTALAAGSYPALVINDLEKGSGPALRKGLVLFQFSLSTVLFICGITIFQQLDFMQAKNLGLKTGNIVYGLMEGESKNCFEFVREKLKEIPGVVNVTACNPLPAMIRSSTPSVYWDGKEACSAPNFSILLADTEFIDTFNVEIKEGRNFYSDVPADRNNYIINETAARHIGNGSPLGKRLKYSKDEGLIIGVIRDFNFRSLRIEITPLIISANSESVLDYLVVAVEDGDYRDVLPRIREVWNDVNPGYSLDLRFMDEEYETLYRGEERLADFFLYFSLLAIFLSCLGLFGLASFWVEQRTKEIGIRKTLGSSTSEIFILLTGQFSRWVLSGILVAFPVGYFVMESWLANFAYRIDVRLTTFLIAGGVAWLIAVLSMSFQALRTARSLPVDALRYE